MAADDPRFWRLAVTIQQVNRSEQSVDRDTSSLGSCLNSAPVGKAFSPASPILADENAFPTEAFLPAIEWTVFGLIVRNEGLGARCAFRPQVSGKRAKCTPTPRTR